MKQRSVAKCTESYVSGNFQRLGRLGYQDLAAIKGKQGLPLWLRHQESTCNAETWSLESGSPEDGLPTPIFKGDDVSWRLRSQKPNMLTFTLF